MTQKRNGTLFLIKSIFNGLANYTYALISDLFSIQSGISTLSVFFDLYKSNLHSNKGDSQINMNHQVTILRLAYYLALLVITVSGMMIFYFMVERLITIVFCSLARKRLRNTKISLKIGSVNLRLFGGLCILINDIEICSKNIFHLYIQRVSIQFNKKKEKTSRSINSNLEPKELIVTNRNYVIELTGLSAMFFKTESAVDAQINPLNELLCQLAQISDVEHMLESSIFSFRKTSAMFYFESNNCLNLSIEVNSFYLAFSKYEVTKDKSKKFVCLKPAHDRNKRPGPPQKRNIYQNDLKSLEAGEKLLQKYVHSVVSTARDVTISLGNHQMKKNEHLLKFEFLKIQSTMDNSSLIFEGNELTIVNKIAIKQHMELNVDLWNAELLELVQNHASLAFLSVQRNFVHSVAFPESFKVNLKKQNDVLFSVVGFSIVENINDFEIPSNLGDSKSTISIDLDRLEFLNLFSQQLVNLKNIRVELKLNEQLFDLKLVSQDDEDDEFKESSSLFSNYIHLNDFTAQVNLACCLYSQLKILKEIYFFKERTFCLVSSLEKCVFQLPIDSKPGKSEETMSVKCENFSSKFTNSPKEQMEYLIMLVLKKVTFTTDLNLFNDGKRSSNLELSCEKIAAESSIGNLDTKIQVFTAPLLVGSPHNSPLMYLNRLKSRDKAGGGGGANLKRTVSNISTNTCQSFLYTHVVDEKLEFDTSDDEQGKEYFFAHNCFYLTVFQLRYQSFRPASGENSDNYAHQFELICGDLFGTMNFDSIFSLTNLVYSFYVLAVKETHTQGTLLSPYFKNSLEYRSIRALTSLVNINIILDRADFSEKNNSKAIVNLVLSPASYGACDFHFNGRQAGHLCILPDLQIRVLVEKTTTQVPKYSFKATGGAHKHVEMIECFRSITSFLSDYKSDLIQEDAVLKKLEYLKLCDKNSQRLWFLWSAEDPSRASSCSCCGNSEFFSVLAKSDVYDFSEEFSYKPCILTANRTRDQSNQIIFGFGKSILQHNQIVMFSDRTFLPEDLINTHGRHRHRHKVKSSKKFIVLANMESHSPRKNFEPIEICVYDTQLTKFLNEKIDLSLFKSVTGETVYLNSTNMSPPYFSNEFNIYIRYLPLVKNISNMSANLAVDRKSDLSDCLFCEISRIDNCGANYSDPPYSDLNIEYVKKYSMQSAEKSKSSFSNKFSTNRLSVGNVSVDLSLNSSIENVSALPVKVEKKEIKKKSITTRKKSKKTVQIESNLPVLDLGQSTDYNSYFSSFKFNSNQINSGFELSKADSADKKFSIEEVFIKTIGLSKSGNESTKVVDHSHGHNKIQQSIRNRAKSNSNCFNVGKYELFVTKHSIDLLTAILEKIPQKFNDFEFLNFGPAQQSGLFRIEEGVIKYLACGQDRATLPFPSLHLIDIAFNDLTISIGTEGELTLKSIDFVKKTDSVELIKLILDKNLVRLVQKVATGLVELLKFNFKLRVGSYFNVVSNAALDFASVYLAKENVQDKSIIVKNVTGTFEYATLQRFVEFILLILNEYQESQPLEANNCRIKIIIEILNFTIYLQPCLLVNLDCQSFQLFASNQFEDASRTQALKCKFQTSVRLELVKSAANYSPETRLISATLDINKKLLDANLSCDISIDDSYLLKILKNDENMSSSTSSITSKSSFIFNFIFPVVFDAEFSSSGVKFPGMLCYFIKKTNVSEIYFLAELTRVGVELKSSENTIFVKCDKFRVAKAFLDIDFNDLLRVLYEEFFLNSSEDRRTTSGYVYNSFKFNSNEVVYSFFPSGTFSSNSWLYCKLANVQAHCVLKDSGFEDFEVVFDKRFDELVADRTTIANPRTFFPSLLNNGNEEKNLRINQNMLLKIDLATDLFNQPFDFNRWLNCCSIDSNESSGYAVTLIAILPAKFCMALSLEPSLTSGKRSCPWTVCFRNDFRLTFNLNSAKIAYAELFKLFVEGNSTCKIGFKRYLRRKALNCSEGTLSIFEYDKEPDKITDNEIESETLAFFNQNLFVFILHHHALEFLFRCLSILPNHRHRSD